MLLAGRGRYTDDVRLAGALHAVFVRSPQPHGRLDAVQVDAAQQADGVVAVLTAQTLAPGRPAVTMPPPNPLLPVARIPRVEPLARDTVVYVGQPVALVIARSQAQAQRAAQQVRLRIAPLPPVPDFADGEPLVQVAHRHGPDPAAPEAAVRAPGRRAMPPTGRPPSRCRSSCPACWRWPWSPAAWWCSGTTRAAATTTQAASTPPDLRTRCRVRKRGRCRAHHRPPRHAIALAGPRRHRRRARLGRDTRARAHRAGRRCLRREGRRSRPRNWRSRWRPGGSVPRCAGPRAAPTISLPACTAAARDCAAG